MLLGFKLKLEIISFMIQKIENTNQTLVQNILNKLILIEVKQLKVIAKYFKTSDVFLKLDQHAINT